MKKLGKLSINQDRVMKNEELVNLRGGDYYYQSNCCLCSRGGMMGGSTSAECNDDCKTANMGSGTWIC